MSRSQRQQNKPPSDQQLGRMIVVSAALHVALIIGVVIVTLRSGDTRPLPTAYTVELVNPAALGTSIPGKKTKPTKSAEPSGQELPPAAPPEPKPQVKETLPAVAEPKPEKPPVVEKPVPEKVEKIEKVEKKEPPKVTPPPDKDAVKLPAKAKPVEKLPEKKPEPEKQEVKKVEKKPEPPKPEAKPTVEKAQPKPDEKKPEPKQVVSPTTEEDMEREKKIRAALDRVAAVERIRSTERIREQVESGTTENPRAPDVGVGSGPATLGGEPGEGGGGLVRGLEFIMYTQQVRRKVKEGWIVTERKPGLTAVVRFGVEPNGAIFGMELIKSSGDQAFDQSVLRAVQKANPLPPPPELYQEEFARKKVDITFGGEGRVN